MSDHDITDGSSFDKEPSGGRWKLVLGFAFDRWLQIVTNLRQALKGSFGLMLQV